MERSAAPKPDPQTGEPRPPSAPLCVSDEADGQDYDTTPPPPPEGRSPVLEYYREAKQSRWKGGVITFVGIVVIGVFMGAFDPDIGALFWFEYPYMLLLPLAAALAVSFLGAKRFLTAGADWVQWSGKWVDTYDLSTIKVVPASYSYGIELHDGSGRKVWLPVQRVQANPQLWDLVYNGIVYSVEHYASVKGRAAHHVLGMGPNS